METNVSLPGAGAVPMNNIPPTPWPPKSVTDLLFNTRLPLKLSTEFSVPEKKCAMR